jgi:hypothetical protein
MQLYQDHFEIVIDFDKGRGDPARVFKAMTGLVESFQSLDEHLLGAIDRGLDAKVVLDDVEAGSIKAVLRAVVSDVPDEALKNGDWKRILGHYLLKSKYLILEWCKDRSEVVTKESVDALEVQLEREAAKTDIKLLPAYGRVPTESLLRDVQGIQYALGLLDDADKAFYVSEAGRVALNARLELSPELVRDILTSEVVHSHVLTTVLVKKPDYLGRSQWSFQFQGHKIEASIRDKEWLGRFQARLLDVRPGDSLKVDLAQETFYGYMGEVVHTLYSIDQVIEVIRPPSWGQADAFDA